MRSAACCISEVPGGESRSQRMSLVWKTSFGVIIVGALIAALLGARLVASASRHPNALWHIVHDLCVPAEVATHKPGPCVAVDLAGGYAVLKDLRGQTQVLVIPTQKITGIESEALLEPSSPNYWADAWAARTYVEGYLHRPIPRDDLALAVNSVYGRSQSQLHIHVDCVRPDVVGALKTNLPRLSSRWSRFSLRLPGGRYYAMWLPGAELGDRDPFKLLAEGQVGAKAHMGDETLALVGITGPDGAPGFVLLAHRANPALGDDGHGEYLMDHHCKVLAVS